MSIASRRLRTGRRLWTLAAGPALVGGLVTAVLPIAPAAARPANAADASQAGLPQRAGTVTEPPAVLSPVYSYDMVTAEGGVLNFGGAGWYGNEKWRHLVAPIVGMAVTPDGGGYWLAGANGSVFNLGDAGWYGSLARAELEPGQDIVAMAATADGKGYWLVNQSGAITSFGDAARIAGGAPLPDPDLSTPIVAAAIDSAGNGAWLTDAGGHVYNVGAAAWFGSLAGRRLIHPITAIAAIPSGRGYWLSNAAGDVWHFGGAATGAPAPPDVSGAAVGIAPAANRFGYWVVTDTGQVIPGGDATSRGQSNATATQSGVVGITAAPAPLPSLPADSVGYDINWPQCAYSGAKQAGTLPGPPGYADGSAAYSIAVVGVDGWATGDFNTCLSAEISWAKEASYPAGSRDQGVPPYDLYMFLNSPASGSTIDQTGPAGTCAHLAGNAWASCLAYNYGYNSALGAVAYATAHGAQAKIWWLDIENDICAPGIWNDAAAGEWWSCDLALNDVTIQGAIDALHKMGIVVGVYCTAIQWQGITDSYVPSGGAILTWVAGAPYTSPPYPASYGYGLPPADPNYCTDVLYHFAAETPVMLQETPGNGYAFDPDLSC